jgi:putative DNA-invertase from lambdoid prophage Rac
VTNAAIWARVSTDQQTADNQLPDLERFCQHHGYTITKKYILSDVSAFNGGHKEHLKAMMDDAYRGEFDVLVVWALDRLTRGGIEELLRIVRELRERKCTLISVQEPWCNGTDATTELLISVSGWVAKQESARRSERVKAGLARRRADGKPMGGKASKRGPDKKKRSTEGYQRAWGAAGARRKASEGATEG